MKKLMMLTVLAAMIGFAAPVLNGQQTPMQGTPQGTQEQPSTPSTQSQPGTPSGQTTTQPQSGTQLGAQATFKEINESELPSAVKQAVEQKYSDNKVQKVYQGSDNMYRLELSGDEGEEANIIYFSRTGQLVREESLQGRSM